MKDVKALIRDAQLPETTVEICLHANLQAEFEQLDRQLSAADQTDSLAGGNREIASRIEQIRQDMKDATVDFRLRALPRPRWRALVAEHEPRKDGDDIHREDQFIGVNTETFFDALLRVSVVDPVLDDEDWQLLGENLTDRQFDTLATAAWKLNRTDVDVPFSPAASKILNSEPE